MLSILVYGRNDAHGYNLHKRAALSLNAIAQTLTDPSDEIIFVDYNTPPDLPTFPEAISDTLTAEARDRIKVLRVPTWIHTERFASRTRLVALEPVARNVGLRRSNPENRWILSTNTDMLFVPQRDAGSLTDVVTDLPDGYYALPRYDIPEALWESLDRRDPQTNLDLLRSWGPQLHLDEVVLSHEYNAFDAPGDFQLALRDVLFDIDGFDEDMLVGWHVDSNLFKRLSLVHGRPGDLSTELAGYHCDHTRLATDLHRSGVVQNDVHRFVENVERPEVPTQASTWGLADVEIAATGVRSPVTARFGSALAGVLPPARDAAPVLDGTWGPEMLHYDPAHVLPYLADPLTVLDPGATIAYVGVNPELVRLLAPLLVSLGFTRPLQVVRLHRAPEIEGTDPIGFDELVTSADAVIFDFGLPLPDGTTDPPPNIGAWPRLTRWQLGAVLECFDRLVAADRTPRSGRDARRYLAVNSRANVFEAFFTSRLATTATPFGTRAQHGFVADIPQAEVDAVLTPAIRGPLHGVFGYEMENWATDYDVGSALDFTWWGDASRFHVAGWSAPEENGTWTDGPVATLSLELRSPDSGARHGYVYRIEPADFFAAPDRPVEVEVLVNGETIGHLGSSNSPMHAAVYEFEVASELATKMQPMQLEFRVNGTSSPLERGINRDARELGVKIRSIIVRERELAIGLGERVVFRDADANRDRLASGWSATELGGVWTDGPAAELLLELPASTGGVDVDLAVELRDVMVTPARPNLAVDVAVDGRAAGRWTFDLAGPRHQLRRIPLRLDGAAARDAVTVTFTIHDPIRPVDVGLGPDERALGVQLASLQLIPREAADPPLLEASDRIGAKIIDRARSRVTRMRARR